MQRIHEVKRTSFHRRKMEEDQAPEAPTPTPVESSSPLVDVLWKEQATKVQQSYLQFFGKHFYESYRRKLPSICLCFLDKRCKCLENGGSCNIETEFRILKQKIGYAMFGPASEEGTPKNEFTGFSDGKLQSIQRVFKKIVQCQKGDKVKVAFLSICLEQDGKVVQLALFRIPGLKGRDECSFVDHSARVYRTWGDFLSSNKLPASQCCFPKDGIYEGDAEGKVILCFGSTPAAGMPQRVLNVMDVAATVGSVGSAVCALFPPAALPCAALFGITSVYSIVRGSVELADRGNHGQSISDREASRHWLSLAGSTLGLGSVGGMAAVKILASQGKIASKMSVVYRVVDALKASTIVVNGASIVENLLTIGEQRETNLLQIFQLTTSIAFFTHSVVTYQTARSLYVETQNQTLSDHGKDLSNKQRRMFQRMEKDTLKGEPNPIIGRAKIIKDLNHISNKNEFFSNISKSYKKARKNAEPVQKVKFGSFVNSLQEQTPAQPLKLGESFTKATCVSVISRPVLLTSTCSVLCTIIAELLENSESLDLLLSELSTSLPSISRHAPNFMKVVRIIMDIRSCSSVSDARKILEAIVNLILEMLPGLISKLKSDESDGANQQDCSSGTSPVKSSEDEAMGQAIENTSFVPQVLRNLDSSTSSNIENEEIYHFPCDHRTWGENGELQPDEYISIGKKALNIASVGSANVTHKGDTGNVYFELNGLVTITSYVGENKVVVRTFPRCTEP